MILGIYGVSERVLRMVLLKHGREVSSLLRINVMFYSQNTNILTPKPKFSFRHLKQGIQEFHRKCVLVPAEKTSNIVVVGRAYKGTDSNEML